MFECFRDPSGVNHFIVDTDTELVALCVYQTCSDLDHELLVHVRSEQQRDVRVSCLDCLHAVIELQYEQLDAQNLSDDVPF